MCQPYRPIAALSDQELLDELRSLLSWTVTALARGGDLYAEATRRGLTVDLRRAAFATLLPQIAAGKLAPEAVVAFLGVRRLFLAVSRLPAAEQKELAGGKEVPVLLTIGEPPALMPIRDAVGLLGVVFLGDRLATIPEQEKALRRAQARQVGRERLVRQIERLMAERGITTLTTLQAVEMAVACNWMPRRG